MPRTSGVGDCQTSLRCNICRGYFAAETANNVPPAGSTYSLSNVGSSGLCIDDDGWGTTNDTQADLWTCTGSVIQNWTVHTLPDHLWAVTAFHIGSNPWGAVRTALAVNFVWMNHNRSSKGY